MTLPLALACLLVGLVAGWLASIAMGGGYGLTVDIGVGIAGSFGSGFLFRELAIGVPFTGIAGTIFVAFTGAVVLLLPFHLLVRRRRFR